MTDDFPEIMKDWPMNPATAFKQIMEATFPHVDIDYDAFAFWEKFCDSNGFIMDGVVIGGRPLYDVFEEVSKAGHAIAIFDPNGQDVKIFVDVKDIGEKTKN